MYIVAALMKDAHQARGVVRALADAVFEMEAEQAALLMSRHGAVDVEAGATGWRSQGWSGS